MGAFHAYDIRGIYNKDFDRTVAYKVGYFLPELLKTDSILVGRDVRESSPEIHDYLLAGITDAGASVYDIGLATTPMVYYATATMHFDASVQITASHNAREYNGLKISRANALPVGYDSGLSTIEKWIAENRPTPAAARKGEVHPLDIMDEYKKFQGRYKGDYSNLSIGIDISNGMAAMIVKDLLGDGPHYIFDDMDGRFPNHEANPLIAGNREALCRLVKEQKCDIGVIYDGDADRVMFVDENSRFVSPDLIIALLGYFFFDGVGSSPAAEKHPAATVLQDIRSSKAVGEFLSRYQVKMATWRVGRAFAAPRLREIDGLFGGELAGHYYFKDFFYSDSGIMASLIVLDIVAQKKKEGISFSELIAGIEGYKNSGEINYKIEKKQEAMDAVRDYFTSREKAGLQMDFDGYRVEFKEWWFNIRPSNTEPYLRFICEATSQELLDEKIRKVNEILQDFQ